MPFAATCMDLEIIIISKSDIERQISYDITYMWNLKKSDTGTSLVVQQLRLPTPNAGGPGSIPGRGTRSHMHATTKKSTCCNEDPACSNQDPMLPKINK